MATLDDNHPAAATDPAAPEFDEATARRAARLILAKGRTAEEIRAFAAAGDPDFVPMFLMIADAMDALLAEGFDPAAYAESLRPVTCAPRCDANADLSALLTAGYEVKLSPWPADLGGGVRADVIGCGTSSHGYGPTPSDALRAVPVWPLPVADDDQAEMPGGES